MACGEKTDRGEPSGPRATSAVSPCSLRRGSGPAIRKQDKCARNPHTQSRSVRLSSDIFAAVFLHSGGTEAKGDEIVGRRCRVGRADSAFATPDSPSRKERTNIGEDIARTGHFGGNPIASFRGGLTRAGKQKAAFTNLLRGFDAYAEPPWALWGKQTGQNENSAQCVILAGSP